MTCKCSMRDIMSVEKELHTFITVPSGAELKNIKLCEFEVGKGVSAIKHANPNDL